MTTIRILHPAGVGEWAKGAVVSVEDRRARRLASDGYAEVVEVVEPTKKKRKDEKE